MESRQVNSGFTLIQVLVGLAITVIMFTLLFLPLGQSFQMARRGRVLTALQTSVQRALEQIDREVSQALVVYRERSLGPLDLLDGGEADERGGNNSVLDDDRFGRIDFVLPQHTENGIITDPMTPAQTVVTYYGRLRDPTQVLTLSARGQNPRILYRAEYTPTPTLQNPVANPDTINDDNSWYDYDLSGYVNPANVLHSHTAVTPLDGTDVLRFFVSVVEAPDNQKSIVIEIALQLFDPATNKFQSVRRKHKVVLRKDVLIVQ